MKNTPEKPEKIEKVAMVSGDVENENLQKLRAVFPQFVKDGAIDFDALQAFFKKEGVLAGVEKYGLSWAGKSKAFADIRRPATSTLSPLSDESKNWDTTENIFIEGENLEVLKLLQKKYANPGKIKMIYIDPPYNTGKDFIYTDNFTENKKDYYERTGQNCGGIKLTSNLESNGRYHSDWLTMMYPRLFLARNLLRDDGVIFVSIDDNEVANLRMLMDEIFGEENFLSTFIWKKKGTTTNVEGATASSLTEYILCYGKNENGLNLRVTSTGDRDYPHKDKDGNYRLTVIEKKNVGDYERQTMIFPILGQKPREGKRWQIGEQKARELESKNRFILEDGVIKLKIYDFEDKDTTSANPNLLLDVGSSESASKELKEVVEGSYFDTPKPVSLIKHLIKLATSEDENNVVLDFFAGSGTTAHAVMDLNAEDGGNRKWVCVQVPEGTGDDSEACKAGYKTISALSLERIHRAGEAIKHKMNRKIDTVGPSNNRNTKPALPLSENIKNLDIGFKAFSLSPSNYSEWNVLTDKDDEKTLLQQAKLFAEQPLVKGYDEKSVVYEILLKEGFDLNAKIAEMKKSGIAYYQVSDSDKEMAITFAKKLTMEQVDGLELPKDTTFVCLDSALDDTTKVNIARNLMVKTI